MPRLLVSLPGFAGVLQEEMPRARSRGRRRRSSRPFAVADTTRGIENVAVRRIHGDVAEAGVLIDELHEVPRGPAVRRLVDPALGVGAKEMALGRDVHHLGVSRVDHDPSDRLCFP